MAAATDRSAPEFSLSGGDHDASRGIELLDGIIERTPEQKYILIDKAYEGKGVRDKAIEKGFLPVVPPKSSRRRLWKYDRERHEQHNEIERYFLRLKRPRRVFTRYDKPDVLFCSFIYFAMIVDEIV